MIYSQLRLIDSSNIVSNCIVLFHDFCLVIIFTILVIVTLIVFICYNSNKFVISTFTASNILEITWTILPIFFLFSLRLPSFLLMYFLEGETKSDLTFKGIRHQWYWSYESSDFKDFSFDSYIVNTEDLKIGDSRLLEVDNSLTLPFLSKIRMVITSSDVLHSWALPSMCVKLDAVPGRLNTLNLFSSTPGVFYRQCSEICRVNHSFIPINVEFVRWEDFFFSLYIFNYSIYNVNNC